jgi:F-type H+-transporting ATPase subunit b
VGIVATTLLLAAEGGGEAEEVKNPILPVENEIVYAAIFFVLIWVLMKFVFLPPILRIMEERSTKIRGDMDAAEHAKAQAELSMAEYETALAGARTEAARIVDDARASAESARREVIAEAEAAIAAERQTAASEIAEAKAAALAQLRPSVSSLAVQAARTVVQGDIDEQAQAAVIEQYVNRAGSSS